MLLLQYHLLQYSYVSDILERRGPFRAAHLEGAKKKVRMPLGCCNDMATCAGSSSIMRVLDNAHCVPRVRACWDGTAEVVQQALAVCSWAHEAEAQWARVCRTSSAALRATYWLWLFSIGTQWDLSWRTYGSTILQRFAGSMPMHGTWERSGTRRPCLCKS